MKRTIGLTVCVLAFVATTVAQDAKKPPLDIKGNTTWRGEVTVDREMRVLKDVQLHIKPGTKVIFKPGGRIHVAPGGMLLAAGTKEKMIDFTGEKTGQITGTDCLLNFLFCRMTGVGPDEEGRSRWMDVRLGKKPLAVRKCEIINTGGIWAAEGTVMVMENRFRDCRGGLRYRGKGTMAVNNNTIVGGNITVGEGGTGSIMGNVIIRGTIVGWETDMLVISHNYVHNPDAKGSYGIRGTVGLILMNVFRGGSWVSAQIGGQISHNVFISLPHEEIRKAKKSFDKNCTHEHICGLLPGSKVFRNIFVGASYGAVMGIGGGTCSDSIISSNTFDMRGSGNAIYLNHLPKSSPKNIIIRSNLFMRSGTAYDEKGITDSVKYIDYNLWSMSGLTKGRGRFWKMSMTGKEKGAPGFGGNDVPPWSERTKKLSPEDVVVNPNVKFPFTDEDMLSGKHTVHEVLAHYRKAYTPKPGSPAINAGDPADNDGTDVRDRKPDIGAVEVGAK